LLLLLLLLLLPLLLLLLLLQLLLPPPLPPGVCSIPWLSTFIAHKWMLFPRFMPFFHIVHENQLRSDDTIKSALA
jgi:hypothetical protein